MIYRSEEAVLEARRAALEAELAELQAEAQGLEGQLEETTTAAAALDDRYRLAGKGGGESEPRRDRIGLTVIAFAVVGVLVIPLEIHIGGYVRRQPDETVFPILLLGVPGLLAAIVAWPYRTRGRLYQNGVIAGVALALAPVANIVVGAFLMSAALTSRVNDLTRDVADAKARVAELREALRAAEERARMHRDLLGIGVDGVPLSAAPLVACIVGVVAANAAVFCAFVTWLPHRDRPWPLTTFATFARWIEHLYQPWPMGTAAALLVACASLPLSLRPGAGGLARLGLRRLTLALLLIALGWLAASMTATIPGLAPPT